MSAEVLREAARVMREAWGPAAEDAARQAERPRMANHYSGTLAPTMVAVADWLDETVKRAEASVNIAAAAGVGIDASEIFGVMAQPALAVARAYLGDEAPA